MNKNNFLEFAKDITGESTLNILLQTKAGKWYEQEYTSDFLQLEANKTYGIAIDGGIDFDFKTVKNTDNFYKSFVSQYITKCLMKKPLIIDGQIIHKPSKVQVIENFKANKKDRVFKSYYYTTLYGIGTFVFLSGANEFRRQKELMTDYLNSQNIPFKNEMSEAGWVLRFVIGQSVEVHNALLNKFEIKDK